jgi:hypothetical protein
VLSLWGLIKDVIGDLLDADSRVWRTLWPLAFRPGLLTQEFLRGRRARYTPPFRMYLVLSLAFFIVASISDPGSEVALQIDEGGTNIQIRDGQEAVRGKEAEPAEPAPPTAPAAPGAQPTLDVETRRLVDAVIERMPESERANARRELEAKLAQASPAEIEAASRFLADPCSEENLRLDAGPLLEQYEPRLREACRKIMADQQSFGRALFENIPKMMFIFLPLIAAVMSVLYVRSGRYYVEHLLFVVHFHAFFFLAGIVVLLLERLAESVTGPLMSGINAVQAALGTALVFYVPWYLLRAMRRVYAQNWWKTVPKFALLGLTYFFSLVFTGIGLLAYTALTL